MYRRSTHLLAGLLTVCGVMVLGACTGGDDADTAGLPEVVTSASVTIPPERLTPFCQSMIELTDRLIDGSPDNADQLIIDTYLSLVDDVPDLIEADFLAVLADLQGLPRPSTTIGTTSTAVPLASAVTTQPGVVVGSTITPDEESFDAEGRLPDEESAQRVYDYVQSACRDSGNNPGPPATAPLDQLPEEVDEG